MLAAVVVLAPPLMLAFTIRSRTLPLVGAMGDAIGLHAAFGLCALVAALGVPFA